MRLLIPVLVLLASCTDVTDAPVAGSSIVDVTGRLEYRQLDETSGIAQSRRDEDLLWAVNDDGAPVLYGIGRDGRKRGGVQIRKANNRDWEDLETFELNDTAYLLIADVGDNAARRRDVRLYVVQEPDPGQDKADIAWEIDFSYPDGPRDVEAVAVDVVNERVLVVSKRDIPARLYAVPLRPDSDRKKILAEFLGVVDSLPQPTRRNINVASITANRYWQPTSLAIAADNQSAVLLTYGGIYFYSRSPGEDWVYAFRRVPLVLPLSRLPGAESITMSTNGNAAFVTTEGRRAPLLRVDLTGNRPAASSSVSMMTFNVLNLFDTVDDPVKDDKTYLPLAAKRSAEHVASCNTIAVRSWRDECLTLDWNDNVLDHKLQRIAQTIKQVDEGRGPDIIAFQEVENAAILDRLSRDYLPDANYGPAILIEGQDARGIDVAFLSRLPLVGEPLLHSLRTDHEDRQGDTRGVLQATFRLPNGRLLTGFAVHFPAPYHPGRDARSGLRTSERAARPAAR